MTSEFALWAVASATRAGQAVSGDRSLVVPVPGGLLFANVDGLGHGQEAAKAAEKALAVIQEFAGRPLDELFRRCHEALRGSRGVGQAVAWLDARDGSMTWAAVGEMFGVVFRSNMGMRPRREAILPHQGVVGHSLPPITPRVLAIHEGDVLVLTTDGIRGDFADTMHPVTEDPARVADRILAGFSKGSDDALVLVTRFRRPGL